MDAHKIVIVGGGFAGLRVARELEKRRTRLKDYSITLVDRNRQHLYTPLLYEVSTGEVAAPPKEGVEELREGVSVRFEEYVAMWKKNRTRVLRGEVARVDAEARTVRLGNGETIPYDDLVVAVGSEPATHGISGVAAHACFLKTLRDGFLVRERIRELVEACARVNGTRISVVVAGGGATGTEFAAETAHVFGRLVREGILRAGAWELSLVEAGTDVCPMFSPAVRAHARERLERLGVRILTETKLRSVGAKSVVLAGKDGVEREHATDLAVWTAGVRPPETLGSWGMPTDERGFVKTDRGFCVENTSDIHALGDCVAYAHPKTGARVPGLAQVAIREAGIVAENIARRLERKPPVFWNPPERWITIVPMGGHYAIADFGWFAVRGWFGYALRKVADLAYFCSILPVRNAWTVWRTGARAYSRND